MRDDFLAFAAAEHLQVVRFLMRNAVDEEDARDAAQEAFTAAWRLCTSTPERWAAVTNRRGWIRTVALRAALRPPGQARRRPLTDAWHTVPERSAPHSDPVELSTAALDVQAALLGLPHRQRLAMAFHLDGLSNPDIGRELDCSPRQVGNLIHQARARLKTALAGYHPGEEATDDRVHRT